MLLKLHYPVLILSLKKKEKEKKKARCQLSTTLIIFEDKCKNSIAEEELYISREEAALNLYTTHNLLQKNTKEESGKGWDLVL